MKTRIGAIAVVLLSLSACAMNGADFSADDDMATSAESALRTSTETTLCYPAAQKSVKVSGRDALTKALLAAKAGDHIVVAAGTYAGDFKLAVNGSAASPIVIEAAPGAAPVFTGHFTLDGAYGVLAGMRFNGDGVTVSGDHCRVTRNLISGTDGGTQGVIRVEFTGNARIDHNELASVKGIAVNLQISANNPAASLGIHVDHNYIHDHQAGASEEVIRILTDAYFDTGAVIEDNLLDHVIQGNTGQHEATSLKTSGNILRGNTLIDSPLAAFNTRNGNRNLYEHNFIRNAGGIEIWGDDNIVRSNTLINADLEVRAGNGTMDTHEDGCPADQVPMFRVNPTDKDCVGAHAAARRTQVSDNAVTGGTIVVGKTFSHSDRPETFAAQDTHLFRNSVKAQLLGKLAVNTKDDGGSPQGSAGVELKPVDVGVLAADPLCH